MARGLGCPLSTVGSTGHSRPWPETRAVPVSRFVVRRCRALPFKFALGRPEVGDALMARTYMISPDLVSVAAGLAVLLPGQPVDERLFWQQADGAGKSGGKGVVAGNGVG